ncbi:MAG: hypothetical protein ACTJHW_14530 [Paenalcaligenes sp.]
MKPLLKMLGLVFALMLTACQSIPANKPEFASEKALPPRFDQGRIAPTPDGVGYKTSVAIVITLHVAQQSQAPMLIPIELGDDMMLFAVPTPVLIHEDMERISPFTARDQSTFLMLEMTRQGQQKLQTITEQARGHFLLLSVQGQLVGIQRITEVISDGRLMINTQGPTHTQAILRLLQGR